MSTWLEDEFPRLADSDYSIESPRDVRYNCIAFACDNNSRWWWPDQMGQGYWPDDAPRKVTVSAFAAMLESREFERCSDPSPEEGVVKIALYVDEDGAPKHMARQLPSGRWVSKLGPLEDIEHELRAVEGDTYGTVHSVYKRQRD